jgi:pyruvate dehydrogenase E1 component alpha subunit
MPKGPKLSGVESPAQVEAYYRELLFIRHFEEKSNQVFRAGEAGGYLHVYIGMEATAMGWLHSIRVGWDYVIAAYRIHAIPLILGTDPVACMAEIMGRSGGVSSGKGGSMHLYDVERGFFGGWGIVGGHTPLAGGLGLAAKYRGEDRVTLCFLGDGAANAGVFFESLNMCGLFDLPVIYIIENNEVAMGTRLEYHAADPELWKRGLPFGIESERLDGMDLFQVKADAQRIIDSVRARPRPYLVEVMNYRFAGHGAADHDQSLYRTKEEVERHRARDPRLLLEKYILDHNLMTAEKMEAIDEEVKQEIERVHKEALAMPPPDPAEVYQHVYTDMSPEEGH